MRKKLIALGIFNLILGILILMMPKPNTTDITNSLLIIIGHVLGIVGIILTIVGFGTSLADRL